MRRANAIGDVLGRKGLKLPCVRKAGRRYYALEFIEATDDAKAEAQALLDSFSSIEIKALPVA